MKTIAEEQQKYKLYHDIFKAVNIPLFLLLFCWVYFFKPPENQILYLIVFILTIYSLVTLFFIPTKYFGYRKFFIDVVFYTFFLILFIHFSGRVESPFFPLLFFPIIASVCGGSLWVFFIILFLFLFYFLLILFLSLIYKIWFPLGTALINFFSISIIGYLSFLVVEQVRKRFRALKDLERIKMEFCAMTTHQLRAPISGTKWIIEAILEGDAGRIEGKQREYFEELYKSNERLIKFVNELLNVFKMEELHLKTNIELVNLKDLFVEIIARFSSLIKKKNLNLKLKEEGNWVITSDKRLLDLIFDNLTSNAIRYSKDGGEIIINLKKKNDKMIEVVIKDFGIGISKEEQQNIFRKFFRGKNALKIETMGSGLGLYLTKKAVEKLDGEIWFSSKEGEGTTFFVNLPIKKNDSNEEK